MEGHIILSASTEVNFSEMGVRKKAFIFLIILAMEIFLGQPSANIRSKGWIVWLI